MYYADVTLTMFGRTHYTHIPIEIHIKRDFSRLSLAIPFSRQRTYCPLARKRSGLQRDLGISSFCVVSLIGDIVVRMSDIRNRQKVCSVIKFTNFILIQNSESGQMFQRMIIKRRQTITTKSTVLRIIWIFKGVNGYSAL